ncbi:unnamed protein product [Strongylus vulgaris]|uniref:glucuronosyltransferase n=1 Tax=Strongylus vulgaris TaxID=40348 RepID=A0A3P7JDU2_STRVU|nr:unnamed protein product [Strongylus vulgaris]
MLEAATHGKPLIAVPLFGDQTRNARIIKKFGFGIHLTKASLHDSSVLRNAIGAVLNDTKLDIRHSILQVHKGSSSDTRYFGKTAILTGRKADKNNRFSS